MDDGFHDYIDVFVVVYLDDVVIYSVCLEDHVHHLRLGLVQEGHPVTFESWKLDRRKTFLVRSIQGRLPMLRKSGRRRLRQDGSSQP